MSGHSFNIRNILGAESSDGDQVNKTDTDSAPVESEKRKYKVSNEDNLKIKLTRENKEDNTKRKMTERTTGEGKRVKLSSQQDQNETGLDLTKKKPNGNDMVKVKVHDQKTNPKQQKEVTNMTENNTIMTKGQLNATTTPATDEQLKNTTGKAVVYKVMTPQGRQYLTNIHTRNLGKSIIPQKMSPPTTDTQRRHCLLYTSPSPRD